MLAPGMKAASGQVAEDGPSNDPLVAEAQLKAMMNQ
jgi:hypothetical protein